MEGIRTGNQTHYMWWLFLSYTHYVVFFIKQVFISIDVEQGINVKAGMVRD
ncbi:hypothetical protein NUKP2_48140 [Klebsiella quasipneumoniae]|jgi:hypothetical protein|nr:hypothetical protein NUKP2_48140 [Klebsiella quasipneumoniae]